MGKSTTKRTQTALWVHKGKQLWCKKVGKTFHYFGSVAADPTGDEALQQWLAQKDRILAGQPKTQSVEEHGVMPISELADRYLVSKRRLVESGDRVERTWKDAKAACDRMVSCWGKQKRVRDITADDFEKLRSDAAETCGPRSLDGLVVRVRCVFNWATESGLIDWPIRYGEFKLSSRKVLDRDAQERGDKTIPRESVLTLLKAADVQMRAMLYLCINAAYGPSDLGNLPLAKIDGTEWLSFPRVKTAAARRCWLWPETRKAIAEWLAVRPTDLEGEVADLLFVTHRRNAWARNDVSHSPVSNAFTRLAEACGIEHRGIYGLRHTHRTISDEAKDQPAAMYVMGHLPPSRDMSSRYRKAKDISDDRVKSVCQVVHDWLHPIERPANKVPQRSIKAVQTTTVRVVGRRFP
jgi:integrase